MLAALPSGWRNARLPAQRTAFTLGDREVEVVYRSPARRLLRGGRRLHGPVLSWSPDAIDVEVDGRRSTSRVTRVGDVLHVQGLRTTLDLHLVPRFAPPETAGALGGLVAPMPGVAIDVRVAAGDTVVAGQVLVVLEAMKMEHHVSAPDDGVVTDVHVRTGDQVPNGAVLLVIEPLDDTEASVMTEPIRIANCSGFYGDRLSAAPGDGRRRPDRRAHRRLAGRADHAHPRPNAGRSTPAAATPAPSSRQMEQVMGTCLDRGIKVVVERRRPRPRGLRRGRWREVADRLGLAPTIAYVEGDDLLPRLGELRRRRASTWRTSTRASRSATSVAGSSPPTPTSAAGASSTRSTRGADIVVTGRVTDAARGRAGPRRGTTAGRRDDWDALAGAVVAGHVIECGTQATGGNYSFFTEVPGLARPGLPDRRGRRRRLVRHHQAPRRRRPGLDRHRHRRSCSTRSAAPPTSTPTSPPASTPSRSTRSGPDRVRVERDPGRAAAAARSRWRMNYARRLPQRRITIALTGLDIEAKAELVERAVWADVPGRARRLRRASTSSWSAPTTPTRPTNEEAVALLAHHRQGPRRAQGRAAFSNARHRAGAGQHPGLLRASVAPDARPRPTASTGRPLVPADLVPQHVVDPAGGDRPWSTRLRPRERST